MKKFGKIFGVAALAVATLTAGAVGLTGCGNKVKMAEVEKLVASQSTSNIMSTGYTVQMKVNGLTTDAQVLFLEEGGIELAAVVTAPAGSVTDEEVYAETYVRDGYAYARESKTAKYVKTQLSEEDQSEIQDTITEFAEMADLTPLIQQYVSVFKQVEGNGLKLTKTEKGNVVSYKMSYKDASGTTSFTIAYKGNQLIKFDLSATVPSMGYSVAMKYELLDTAIVFPEDLDTNVETPEISEGDEGEEESGEEQQQIAA